MLNRKPFYDSLRAKLFGGKISGAQVAGIERLLNTWEEFYSTGSRNELAYDLATSFHETGATMQPITELGPRSYFDKYEPGTKLGVRLGNTIKGDGYKFRGQGDVQNTGRRNAAYSSRKLNETFGLNVDFVNHPETRGDPVLSAHCLFLGNRQGWWTGRNILQFVDDKDESDAEDLREWTNARAVVNGTDRAATIAGYALKFETALKAGGI